MRPMESLEPWQWALAFLGAFLVGLAKTGVAGIGILFVAIFANILPAREAVGVVLPLLICGDLIAVATYRRHAKWQYLWRLFPWTAAGVVGGYFVMDRIDDAGVSLLTGTILLTLITVHLWRKTAAARRGGEAPVPKHPAFAVTMGIFAGFTTMVSNAAGPIMILYLLAMRLPKMEFLGTGAVYFLIMNLFKVPFGVSLGIITAESLKLDLKLIPFVIAGAVGGRLLITRIPQKLFETLALVFTSLAALRLLAMA